MMDTWRGHLPITYETMLSILNRATAGTNDFSHAERVLYTTCEFWAAVAARSLVTHLGSRVAHNLQNALLAFSTIGAVHLEHTLSAALRDLANANTKQQRLECLIALEDELPKANDPVDQLIARFAEALNESSGVYYATGRCSIGLTATLAN